MRRGYRRHRRHNVRRLLILGSFPAAILSLSLLWIWKSNQVKEFYSIVRRLETVKTDLNAENDKLRAEVMDLKSLSAINKFVTEQFGMTQNVARLSLPDPVAAQATPSRAGFAVQPDIPGWLEQTVTSSGKVQAEHPKAPVKRKGER